MSQVTPMMTSFNGGELSPRMLGRVDQAIYQISVAEMLNFVPTIEGPAAKRAGFRHIRAADVSSIWLSPFIFSVTQAYVIEWGEAKIRIYTNGGRIETAPNVAYEVTVPYTAAEAPHVSQQQSYDRLYLAHSAHPFAALTRTSGSTFAYASEILKNGPFADQNINQSLVVTAAGTLTVGGTVTLSCGTAIFQSGHVGAPFMVEAQDFSTIKAWEAGMDGISIGDVHRSDGKAYTAASSGRTGSVQPTHTQGTEWDGSNGTDVNTKGPYGVAWTYRHDRYGMVTITAVAGDGKSATCTVTRRIPDSIAGGTYRWSHGAFSNAAGWPKVVLLAFGRLIFFTDFEILASVVADYGGGTVNMSPFTDSGLLAPDMAFRLRLAISNPILWAKEDRDVILVGTGEAIYAIRKINSGQIFSSDNIECVRQPSRGCEPVWPAQIDRSTIFVQRGGRKLREASYDLQGDGYLAPNMNVWQRHILKGGAIQLAFQAEPEELLFAVRGDGQVALHPHVPEQQVRGFARLAHAAGSVLSTCVIPGSSGGAADEVWALVERSGDNYKSVEQQAAPWLEGETELADAFFVDSGATYSGAPTTTITSGLDHLLGKAVAVLADGAVIPDRTVDGSGHLTPPLDAAAANVTIGLGYTARLTWLRPEIRDSSGGTAQGKRKRLVAIILRVLETVGVKVDPGTGKADELIDRPGSAPMDAPVPPFTGDTTAKSLGGDWGRDAQGTIISDLPLPCMIVGGMPKIEIGS